MHFLRPLLFFTRLNSQRNVYVTDWKLQIQLNRARIPRKNGKRSPSTIGIPLLTKGMSRLGMIKTMIEWVS
jgi:hypothetical protein